MADLPNGLTEEDQRYCFEMASAIWKDQTTATVHNGYGIILSLSQLDELQNDLMARLAALSATSVSLVQELIYGDDDGFGWKDVRKGSMEVNDGGSDTARGVSFSMEDQRQSIKGLFDGYVGCMSMARAIARRQDQERGKSSCIPIARG